MGIEQAPITHISCDEFKNGLYCAGKRAQKWKRCPGNPDEDLRHKNCGILIPYIWKEEELLLCRNEKISAIGAKRIPIALLFDFLTEENRPFPLDTVIKCRDCVEGLFGDLESVTIT